jgi:hypothetical protein
VAPGNGHRRPVQFTIWDGGKEEAGVTIVAAIVDDGAPEIADFKFERLGLAQLFLGR